MQVSLVDISRAYFHAQVEEGRPLYVELPPEDEDYGKGLCGRLNVHMYGTRPAAEGWHSEYATTLVDMGFVVGESSACVFFHPELWLASSVHGDDFATIGPKSSLDRFVKKLKQDF